VWGAKYKTLKLDPKTVLERCETLMLDMDGTILDLAFDNHVWKELVPARYAEVRGIPLESARDSLFAKYTAIQGQLEWYCLDHWSERLGFDVLALHREVRERIVYLPGAKAFLEGLRDLNLNVLLVTNSHPDTLALKESAAEFSTYFDDIFCSHTLGHAKERQGFWQAVREATGFDPVRTLFVDDTEPVLASAEEFGIRSLLTVTRPDTTEPVRTDSRYAGIEGVSALL
jgi:GMP/IMP 5'-nucleotidase